MGGLLFPADCSCSDKAAADSLRSVGQQCWPAVAAWPLGTRRRSVNQCVRRIHGIDRALGGRWSPCLQMNDRHSERERERERERADVRKRARRVAFTQWLQRRFEFESAVVRWRVTVGSCKFAAVLAYRSLTGDVPQYLRQFVRVADMPSRHRLSGPLLPTT